MKTSEAILKTAFVIASVFSGQAYASMAYADISWDEMRLEIEPSASLQGLTGFTHIATTNADGVSQELSSSDPFQNLKSQSSSLPSGQAYAFAMGGGLGSSVVYVDTVKGTTEGRHYFAGTFAVDGPGWLKLSVPYELAAIAYENQDALAAAMIYVADQSNSANSFYQNVVAVGQNGVNQTLDGSFEISLYNDGGLRHYTFNAYSFAQATAPIPEPEGYALMVLGLGGVIAAKRMRRIA